MVIRFLPVCQRHISVCLLAKYGNRTKTSDECFLGCASVACIGVDLLFLVLVIKQGSDNLRIVNVSGRGMDLNDELGESANLSMELVAADIEQTFLSI